MSKDSLLTAKKSFYIVVLLLLLGAFFRIYNLNWGAPFYFHPDERNIADLVLKTSLGNPATFLKGTFAYGNFPVIFALYLKPLFIPIFNFLKITDPFANAIIILRIIEFIASIALLFIVYLSGKLFSERIGLIALALAVFSTGLIQQAHFGTFDGWIALFSVCTFYFCLKYHNTKYVKYFYTTLLAIVIGATAKITLIVLAIFPVFLLLLNIKNKSNSFAKTIFHLLLGGLILVSLTLLLSPYYTTIDFRNSLIYEKNLVSGNIPVFYTQSFSGTIPVLFQFLHIYPFLINPLLTIIFIPCFIYTTYKGIKNKNIPLLLLNSYFLILFIPQAFLFAKWTRYMVPTLPFTYLIISIGIVDFLKNSKKLFSNRYLVLGIILFSNFIFGISYFITAFVKPDTRVQAADFAKNNIPQNAVTLSEPYDLGITPFNSSLKNISFFTFYDLDMPNSNIDDELQTKLENSNYIVLPSQRLVRSRILDPKNFPKGNGFYSLLTHEAAGFQKIYETPCDIFCKITYIGDPIFSFEETASVFERPTVMIFKRISK